MPIPSRAKRDRELGRAVGMLAWSLWVLNASLVAAAGFVVITHQPHFYPPWPTYQDLFVSLSFLAVGAIGALITARQPGNILGELFWFMSFMWSFSMAGQVNVDYALPGREFVSAAQTPARELSLLVFACSLLLFPDGRLPSAARRPVAWVIGGAVAGYILTQAVHS